MTVYDQSEADHEIDVPCRFSGPGVDYFKDAPNEIGLLNSVPEKRVALGVRGRSEKCQIVGGINHSGERLQAGRSSGQLVKSHRPCAAVKSPFFEPAGAAVTRR